MLNGASRPAAVRLRDFLQLVVTVGGISADLQTLGVSAQRRPR
jgi:hypothetical protein